MVVPSILRKPYLSLFLFVASAPLLIAAQNESAGWLLLALSALFAWVLKTETRESLWAVILALAILGSIPISTNINPGHFVLGFAITIAAVVVPYLWLERWRKYGIIKYKFWHGRRWYRAELLYVLLPAVFGYFVAPYFFRTTHNYLHWHVELTVYGLTALLIGLIGIGIWDEFFFVATIASVFRRHLPFWLANMAQAVIFSSFLYALGFRDWGVIFAYIFALTQCYIFKVTNSLIYAITIHVAFDVVLFFALIHAYYPQYLRFFVTG